MSHTLARLRRTFDDKLFVRIPNGMVATDKSIEIYQPILSIINQVEALFLDQRFEPKSLNATVKIMTHDFIATNYLAEILTEIRLQAPLINFDVQSYSPNCYELLSDGKVDIVLAAGLNANKQFFIKEFRTETLVCLVDQNHPAIDHWSIEKMYDFEHIKFNKLEDKNDPVQMFAKKNPQVSSTIGLYTDSLEIQPSLLAKSELIAFLPESIAQKGAKDFGLKVLPFPFQVPSLTINSVWHRSKNDNTKHAWLRSFF